MFIFIIIGTILLVTVLCWVHKRTRSSSLSAPSHQIPHYLQNLHIPNAPYRHAHSVGDKTQYHIAVMLTTFITEDPKRKQMYEQNVKRWLSETDFDIFLVDSSNQGLSSVQHPRLHVLVFDQSKDPGVSESYLSNKEKNSVLKAYHHFRNKLHEFDYVFKITGKYVIPNLRSLSETIPKGTDIIVQHLQITHGQNTECVGFRPHALMPVMNLVQNEETREFEKVMHQLTSSNKFKVHRLPPITLDQGIKRTDGSILKELYE